MEDLHKLSPVTRWRDTLPAPLRLVVASHVAHDAQCIGRGQATVCRLVGYQDTLGQGKLLNALIEP